jgi:hypothetical protein
VANGSSRAGGVRGGRSEIAVVFETPAPGAAGWVAAYQSCTQLVFNNLMGILGILRKGSRYEGQPSVVGMLRIVRSKNRRGTELLDALAEVLPTLYSFSKENDLDFASTITLLDKYWDDLRKHIDKDEIKLRGKFINILNRMVSLYRETNIPVAFGFLIVACHIESSNLNEEEARLAHSITGIHIDRAKATMKDKSTKS